MTATPETIAARREVLALLVEAGAKGLDTDQLVARCCKRVKGLTEKQAREVLTSLSTGGGGRGVPNVKRKGGRWITLLTKAPSEVRLIEVTESEVNRAATTRRRGGVRDQVLTFLENLGDWVSKRQLLDGVGQINPKTLRALIDENAITRIGSTTSVRYSAAHLRLDPPADAKPSRKAPPATARHAGAVESALSPNLKRALDRLDDAIADLKKAAKAA